MQGAAHDDDADAVYGFLVKTLAEFGEEAEAGPDGVRLKKWPSVCILVESAEASRNVWGEWEWDSGTWSAWLDLIWQYDSGHLATVVKTQAIGQGLDRSGAVEDAVATWGKGIAPVLLSHMRGAMVGGAETWPQHHPQSIPGWRAISGPYLVLGEASKTSALEAFLRTHALIEPVRAQLAVALATGIPFHTVSLYRAVTPSGVVANVLIDNRVDEEASKALKRARWPEPLTQTPFLSAQQFLLCIAPIH